MAVTSDDIRQSLLANDPEFRTLAEEHSRCESQLQQLITEPYVNSERLILEVTLKKMKLNLKDRMEMIVARRQNGAHVH